jgi:hypothetical protein
VWALTTGLYGVRLCFWFVIIRKIRAISGSTKGSELPASDFPEFLEPPKQIIWELRLFFPVENE